MKGSEDMKEHERRNCRIGNGRQNAKEGKKRGATIEKGHKYKGRKDRHKLSEREQENKGAKEW